MKKLIGTFFGCMIFVCSFTAAAVAAPVEPCNLGDTLDAPGLTWTTGGDADWFCQDNESFAGDSSAQSGAILDNETSWLETTVTISDIKYLSFYWKASAQSGDYLRFEINGDSYGTADNGTGWQQRIETLLPDTYTLRWVYDKDLSGSDGADAGWLDKVELVDEPSLKMLQHYGLTYAEPQIPEPLFVKNRVAKAAADECYDNGTVLYPKGPADCINSDDKTNQAYVWGMARSGNIWFGTVANTQCLITGGLAQGLGTGLPAIEAENFVCEYNEADNGTILGALGDWRPPQIWEYNPETFVATDRTPQDLLDNPTLGIRSAGAIDGVVLLAGPSLDGTGINVFVFSDDGTYLGMDVLTEYNDIRQWVVHDGVMYTGVQKTTAAGLEYKGRILRYNGLSFAPFQIDFEVVGRIDLEAANMVVHNNRLFVTTWPSLSVASLSPYVSGLWMSPEIPADTGLTGSDNESWAKVWSVTDYEPDTIVARTYGGGALASYDGTLFWGTMHVPFSGTLAAMVAEGAGIINLKGLDNETMGVEDIVATALGTHRATSVFSSTFETSPATIELLYGDEYLPVYDPVARGYTIAYDELHRNNMDNPVPEHGPSGLGNFFNAYTWTMDVGFEEYPSRGGVLLGTFDWSFVARDLAGTIIEQVVDDDTDAGMVLDILMMVFDEFMEDYSYGADLFVIQDVDDEFVLESKDGAGNYLNYGIRTMQMPVSATEAVVDAPAVMAEDECDPGYFGMANPFNLADDGGWEVLQVYPLPELALIAPTSEQFVMGDFTLQAQDLSACPLSSVDFSVIDTLDMVTSYSAEYNPASGFWEYVIDTTLMPNGVYIALAQGSDSDGVPALSFPQLFVVANDCVEDGVCDDGVFCNGVELCDNGTCAPGTEPCDEETEVCLEDTDTCVPRECSVNRDCDDDLFCTGAETCEGGLCSQGGLPCNNVQICVEEMGTCLPRECSQNSDCDDGLFCTGTETCDGGFCEPGEVPCEGEEVCAEETATCVECLSESDCSFGYTCEETANVCSVQCPLTVSTKKDKPIIVKPGKDKKVKLFITGGEGFDPEGVFDAGPFTYKKRKYKENKGLLKIWLTVPADLAPGTYQISVGECLGEVTFSAKN